MAQSKKSILVKILKVTGITFVISLLLIILLPIVFADTITEKVKVLANKNLEGELNFNESELSFFKHFPSLTLTLHELNLNGSQPYKNKSLVSAKEISFGIDVWSVVFGNQTEIEEIYLEKAKINILVNQKGEANYNIYKSDSKDTTTSSESASLKLENIQINNSQLVYNDKSTKIIIEAKGFNYKGKGDLLESNFSLKTSAKIDSLSFTYDKNEYLKNKKLKADLITKINTNSLSFVFEKNDLVINKLPVEFTGFFDFLKNGYQMDFKLKTENSDLDDLFTALPAEYVSWMNETKMKGKTTAFLTLKGKYIASENLSPEVNFNIKVRDGYVKHEKAPYPVENIFLNFDTKLPNLDINQLKVRLDSLYFDVNKNNLSAILISDGFGKKITIDSKVKSKLDLAFLSNALQVPNFKLAGNLDAEIVSKGIYSKEDKKFPITKGNFEIKNGLIQTAYYPKPIQNINLKANLNSPTGNFKDASFILSPANFTFEGEPFNLNASFKNFDDINYDVKAKGTLNVARIYKVFSQKGLDVDGFIKADLSLAGKQSDASNGRIGNLKNSGTLEVKNIKTTSDYLAKPFLIENGLFTFNQDKMNFSNFNGKYGTSDISMNGNLENVINFVLSENQILKGSFNLTSNFLNINEFIPTITYETDEEAEKTEVSGVVEIPTNLNVSIQTNAAKTQYEDVTIENLRGNVLIQNGTLHLSKGTLGIIGATAKMDAFYKNEGTQKAYFDYKINASEFDIKRAYNEIKMFREIVTAAESAEGIVGLNYSIKGVLNNQMEPVMPSLEGSGTLSVKKVKMKGFKLLNVVSAKTENPDIKDPDISKVDIKTTIKNNIVTIERFKFKVAGFRLRFEGQTSLDGKLNLKMRIGLPPLGILGIPIKVLGTQENPDIKLGRKSENLEETEYVDGVTPINTTVPATTTPTPTIQNDSVPKIEPAVPVEKVE
ncbi:AsmA-like C-terminal region-containing protein [Flavobacterium lacisediminis]|uniref:AsmA-like C-terminal region-containing protein n=1 Tax=Flavobacterium lacisediminis TaxID=2989705 RepID=A0ABT3EFL2_9FLAO|nr:AsmA-like C-terminal region-containing protein [Flavobacterium lacisediminis]MCW1147372.1 AsmA-like C-terminal region-containing protein [Flavobacterium lacisediminis]